MKFKYWSNYIVFKCLARKHSVILQEMDVKETINLHFSQKKRQHYFKALTSFQSFTLLNIYRTFVVCQRFSQHVRQLLTRLDARF